MFTPKPFRTKASEYGKLAETSSDPGQKTELQARARSLNDLADNEQWLASNYQNTVQSSDHAAASGADLATEEEHILRCMGAAVVLQWDTLPIKLQRELYDAAGAMGDPVKASALRERIARFLHRQGETR